MIKLISLDFWNTIATPNPRFGELRLEILANFGRVSIERAGEIYKEAKTHFDDLAKTGIGVSIPDAYWNLLKRFDNDIDMGDCVYIRNKIDMLFDIFPPFVLGETIEQLSRLREKGIDLIVTSNTNFISGRVLREVVLDPIMDFDNYYFSDEIGLAKPNKELFKMVIDWDLELKPDEILHIGDSKIYDGGATAVGMQCIIIPGAEALPEVLRNIHP